MLSLLIIALCSSWNHASAGKLVEVEDRPVPTLISGANIFFATGEVTGPHDIELKSGDIIGISEHEQDRVFDGVVIDGAGKTLIPGLIDTHVHLESAAFVPGRVRLPNPKKTLEEFLYAGVTAVADLSAPTPRLKKIQESVYSGDWVGPEVFGSGMPFTAPLGHPVAAFQAVVPSWIQDIMGQAIAHQVSTPQMVDQAFVDNGDTPFVKVVIDSIPSSAPEINDLALNQIRKNANAADRRIFAHIGDNLDVSRALQLPVNALVHAPYLEEIDPEITAHLVKTQMPIVATLSAWESVARLEAQTTRLSAISEETISAAQIRDLTRLYTSQESLPAPLSAWTEAMSAGISQENIRALHAAGARILVGSDSPNLGHFAGGATHRELALLESIGMSPSEVLLAATWYNSRLLNHKARFGAVKIGYQADLLLVHGNPAIYLDNISKIDMMWVDGRRVFRHPR